MRSYPRELNSESRSHSYLKLQSTAGANNGRIVIIASKFGYGTLTKNVYSTITMKWFVFRLLTKNGTTKPRPVLLQLKTRRQRLPTRSRAAWPLKALEYAYGGMVLNGMIRGVYGVKFIDNIMSVFLFLKKIYKHSIP